VFLRLLFESFRRQQRRKLLAGAAVFLGITAVTAMLALGTSVGDRINRELNESFGANLVVYPRAALMHVDVGGVSMRPGQDAVLQEVDLPKLKAIFWRNNITAISPELSVPVEISSGHGTVKATATGTWFRHDMRSGGNQMTTGAPVTHPWWKLDGSWPADDSTKQIALGAALAQKLGVRSGGSIEINSQAMSVAGVVSSGDSTDEQALLPLPLAQQLAGRPGAVDRVLVTALTKPEDAFARRNPDSLGPKDRDRWYCSPYANSIAYQINEAIPGAHAEQLRRVAQNEGQVLERISGLMWLVAIAALLAAILAVSSTMTAAILERTQEIALMRSMGATRWVVGGLFYSEAVLLATVASVLGFVAGSWLAWDIGRRIFATSTIFHPALLPVVSAIGVVLALAATSFPVRRTLHMQPAVVLHGGK
jgi:putative ABC transport system permease protein